MGTDNDNNDNWDISFQNGIDWFHDLLIIKEYEINPDDTYLEQFKTFCMRYRRLLGIIALCILIYIGVYCNSVSGIDNLHMGGGKFGNFTKYVADKGAAFKGESLDKGQRTFSELREKGMASGSILGSTKLGAIGSAGYYATGKMKEYAGWFYQILYAIAISLAICMVVLPSISFFFIGLICYFLLKYKMAHMKAF